jgi:MFS family permease
MTLQRQLVGVTLSLASFNFATGLVGVFIPLVILTSGAPLWQVPAFYVVYSVTKLLINYPIARFIVVRRGVHTAFALGFGAAVAQLGALQLFVMTEQQAWLFVAAVALAFVNGSLWLSQHLHISSVIDTTTKSSSMATIETVNQILAVGAPVFGGFIGAWFGPEWLIATSLVFLVVAFLPLRMIGRLDSEHGTHREQPLQYSLRGAPARDLFANFCWNVESAVGLMVWPIFLAIEVAAYEDIGVITAIAGVFMVITMWVAGRRGDRGHYRRILAEAATASTVINVLRMLVTGITAVAIVTAAYRASLAYAQVTWASGYYGHAKRQGAQ